MQNPKDPNGATPSKKQTEREPWPMWPFALAVAVFIVGYTYLNLSYRKEGRAFEPHQAMLDRREQIVEKNLYDWYKILTTLDTTVTPNATEIEKTLRPYSGPLENFLPEQLVYFIPSRPVLLDGPFEVNSDARIEQGIPFTLRITLPSGIESDDRFHLQAFYKEGSFHILPSFFVEKIDDAADTLATESKQFQFSIPTDPVAANEVSIFVYAEGYIHEWKVPAFPKEIDDTVDSANDES